MTTIHNEILKWGITPAFLAGRDFAQVGANCNPFTVDSKEWQEYEQAFDYRCMAHQTIINLEPDNYERV